MATISINTSTSIGGLSFGGAEQLTVEGQNAVAVTVPIGYTVTAWVKSDTDTASCNLPADHGQTDGKFDVYDSTGAIIRYGVDGTIATNALSLDGGAGATFPDSATTGIVVCKQVSVDLPFTGSLVSVAMLQAQFAGHVDFQTSAPASLYHGAVSATPLRLAAADFNGTNATVKLSNASPTYANEIKIGIGRDATP